MDNELMGKGEGEGTLRAVISEFFFSPNLLCFIL
jgi:hypothetical protein